MEQSLLLWGFGLLLASLLLLALEVFVPSGGVIGLISAVTAVAGIVAFFRVSMTWGLTSVLIVVVLAPIAISFALRVMPHTPVGRRLILGGPGAPESERPGGAPAQPELAIVGAEGVAVTPMHPVGVAEFDGTRLEVLAEGGAVEAGARVRVTSVEGNRVKVRAIEGA